VPRRRPDFLPRDRIRGTAPRGSLVPVAQEPLPASLEWLSLIDHFLFLNGFVASTDSTSIERAMARSTCRWNSRTERSSPWF